MDTCETVLIAHVNFDLIFQDGNPGEIVFNGVQCFTSTQIEGMGHLRFFYRRVELIFIFCLLANGCTFSLLIERCFAVSLPQHLLASMYDKRIQLSVFDAIRYDRTVAARTRAISPKGLRKRFSRIGAFSVKCANLKDAS